MTKSPGKSHRTGITLMQLADMFPDEDTARLWFEGRVWPHGRHCGSVETYAARHPKSPYRCKDCRHYFSVKTGTALENSRIPLRKWAFAIYLETTHVKGIASMKLHRDIGVTQKTAWFMLHRIHQAWSEVANSLDGTIEADEAYIGGLEKNKHKAKKLSAGRGGVGKAKAVALRERETNKIVAKVVDRLDRKTLQELVTDNVKGLVRRYGLSSILHSPAEIQAAPDRDAFSLPPKRSHKTERKSSAVDYVDKMTLPEEKAGVMKQAAQRFDDGGFLPRITDIREFCRIHNIVFGKSVSRASSIPRVFTFLATMKTARIAKLLDEGEFSGPTRLAPIADAIRSRSALQDRNESAHLG